MQKSVLIFIICFPVFVFAQKGTIIPDVKPPISVAIQNDLKTWTIENYLVNCADSCSKCYVIKENGITKNMPVNDVYDFIYEEGNKYTVIVKEELKMPPVNAFAGIYNYKVTKIVSKKNTTADASVIPTVNDNTSNDKTVFNNTPEDYKTNLEDEIIFLKKQLSDLKKQVDIMQLQLEMQLMMFQKK